MNQESQTNLSPGGEQIKKPPVISIGFIGWVKRNLFSTWYNTIFTILGIIFLFIISTNYLFVTKPSSEKLILSV